MKPQATSPAGDYRHQPGAHDKGRIVEEPGKGKLLSPILEQRWVRCLARRR
ncbi:MAG TPA: hypothetical protein VI542_25430 [Candidatus Tectomicrobia bacterium]